MRKHSKLVDKIRSTMALALWAVVVSAVLAGGGRAAVRVELFQATVPLADRSESSQTAAFQAAMRVVLVRVTGHRGTDQDPGLAPLVADNQLWVAFDAAAIERWLSQNAQPQWGRDRPATFVWLAVSTGAGTGYVATRDDSSELKVSIDAQAAERGIPLIWPSTADLQANRVDFGAVNNLSASTLSDIARRLGADATLVGRAASASAAANVRWVHVFQDHSSEFSGAGAGVEHAADTYAGLFAASGAPAPVDIEVNGVADLHAYASVQTYLESLTFVSHVGVLTMNGDVVRFRLTTRGGADALQRALALGGRLEPVDASGGGVQRFHLRR
jgi:hypothetical protein